MAKHYHYSNKNDNNNKKNDNMDNDGSSSSLVSSYYLWDSVGDALRPVFANPSVIKVGHSAFNDIACLHCDFSIVVINCFDTHEAANTVLSLQPSCGLANLCQCYSLSLKNTTTMSATTSATQTTTHDINI